MKNSFFTQSARVSLHQTCNEHCCNSALVQHGRPGQAERMVLCPECITLLLSCIASRLTANADASRSAQ